MNGHQPNEPQVRLGAGRPKGNDQIIEHGGKDLLRIARSVSEELNGSTIDLLETLEGPALGIKPVPPRGGTHLSDDL